MIFVLNSRKSTIHWFPHNSTFMLHDYSLLYDRLGALSNELNCDNINIQNRYWWQHANRKLCMVLTQMATQRNGSTTCTTCISFYINSIWIIDSSIQFIMVLDVCCVCSTFPCDWTWALLKLSKLSLLSLYSMIYNIIQSVDHFAKKPHQFQANS